MTIVFDSNVIISAFITTSGTAKDVFLYCGERFRIIISNYIINEVSEKLRNKFDFSRTKIREVTDFLETHTKLIEPADQKLELSRDKKDNPILSLAVSAGADFLISGDKDLLVLKKVKGVKIISPAEFWKELRK
ncbi:MAG: putative toxin-antitoxin system toxin component, PIN family [Candidatus Omnitrophota bacterium]